MIGEYETSDRSILFDAPRQYGLNQEHKHLKEMKFITGIDRLPLFTPMTTDYYSGMLVQVPLYADLLKKKVSPEELRDMFAEFYAGEQFIKVMPFGAEADEGNVLFADACSMWDGMQIFVTGNEDRLVVATRFDNLGKGASGAAVQCMNLVMGVDEATGLSL